MEDQFDGVDEGYSGDFVLSHADHGAWCLGSAVQDGIDGFDALHCGQHSVKCTWNAASLCMSQGCNTSVEAEFLGKQVFEIIRGNRIEIRINCSFRNNHNRLAFSRLTSLEINSCPEYDGGEPSR